MATSAFTQVAKRHRDGCVLLSTANDRIFKLNGVGALTWLVLEQNSIGVTIADLVRELSTQFERVNADGEMRYEVAAERLKTDTAKFLRSLVESGLVEMVSDSRGGEVYRISEGVSGTTSTTLAALGGPSSQTADGRNSWSPQTETVKCVQPEREAASPGERGLSSQVVGIQSVAAPRPSASVAEAESFPVPGEIRILKRETLVAFMGLLAFDLLLRVSGFQSLVTKVERWPTRTPDRTDVDVCGRVCATVNRAQVYYPKKAMCLQHSAVLTCLLRRHGVAAEMVLAAQEFPPKAHAWVEVDHTVVNDSQQVKTKYRELRRL
jgi:transglutaminase superfamily protein/coenzyme PQQ synthesis protein D (PqqD)